MLNKIRLKLTLTNSAVLLSILFAFSIFVYVNVNMNAVSNTDNDIIEAAYQFKRYIPLIENKLTKDEADLLTKDYLVFDDKMTASSTAYSVWDYNGKLIFYKSSFKTSYEALKAMRENVFSEHPVADKIYEEPDGKYYVTDWYSDNLNLRVCTTVLSNENGTAYIIQTISNMNEKNIMVERLLSTLIIACIIGATLSFVSGYFIAGRAIIPIQENIQRQKEFIADASHELRTPVTIIRTNLDVVLASEDETVKSQSHWINNAYEETQRMEKLISDLLFLAKTDLKQEPLQQKNININALCANIIEKLTPAASQKSIVINFMPYKKELYITGDPNKINQLIIIILDNAIHYSKNNSSIQVTTNKYKNDAQIIVEDGGIGISNEEIKNIFTRFYRSDKARSRRAGGTGLGLSIAKSIVEAHKGEILVESEKGKGTRITMQLPLKEGDKS